MDRKNRWEIQPSPGGGFFNDLSARIKLILRLLADNRINPLLKILPIASVVYLIVPDLAPGPIDDAMVIWLGAYLFVELCPQEIVAEHQRAIHRSIIGQNKDTPEIKEEDIADAEFWEEPK